jgi:hypothetical protein
MRYSLSLCLLCGLLAFGCNSDKPHSYGQKRPDVDALVDEDRGLESKDVVSSSDQMARDMLASAAVRESKVQLTVVCDRFEDHTSARNGRTNYDIFVRRLMSNLAISGRGQIALIENKAKLNELRSNERDDAPGTMTRIQPNYALHGKVFDMPNRSTNYYLFEFDLTDFNTGVIVWSNRYEVKVSR